ncbi:hypothetical protein [Mycoplana rhizolycopersici]|uniref:Uncharacterized protein n=1 Tax=Mycoplana rhizolycopersici TaxID=2746702 RepID=A0ABX2QLE9_9HYPH|nr:hypothetical protein [Rhizobium rhizolycopersici]NVP57119.1 hypothetical protein [Rhizobium rhizolycopersici]
MSALLRFGDMVLRKHQLPISDAHRLSQAYPTHRKLQEDRDQIVRATLDIPSQSFRELISIKSARPVWN